jgi:hypothetical protein
MAKIPLEGTGYGRFTEYDFARGGETYLMQFEDDRDLTRLQIRLRDAKGALVPISNPGVDMMLKIQLR